MRRWLIIGLTLLALSSWTSQTHAQYPAQQLQRWYYYPYYYYPHNYWPTMGPRWPEAPGHPYMKPPGYMAYPPYLQKDWHYYMFKPMKYYRGFHFWLDQF